MKSLLFISSYPLPLYKGSNQHAYFFIKSLVSIFNVYCIFFVQPENEKDFNDSLDIKALGVKEYGICFFRKISPKGKTDLIINRNKYYLKIKRAIEFPYSYMNMATHAHGKQLIQGFIEKYSIDIVHCEHFHYAKYLLHLPSDLIKVVVYHDLYHRVPWEQFKIERKISTKFDLLMNCMKKFLFERMLAKKTNLNIFLNPIEMKFFPKRSVCIPHIVNPEIEYNMTGETNVMNILFLGGYNHQPNRISVQYIVSSILPLLAEEMSNFKVWIIGPGAEKYEEYVSGSPYREFLHLKGYVSDINDVFRDMNVALLPVLYGGGIKTKVIEAMAAGLPVITTPQGVYGLQHLPENCVEICRTPDEFLQTLVLLAGNFSLRKERSAKGKTFIDQHHSVETLYTKVKETYKVFSD